MKRLFIIFLLFPFSAFAVDGYKNIKFGMSDSDILKLKICSFQSAEAKTMYPWVKDLSRYKVLMCTDYSFLDRRVRLYVTFVDARLHKITLAFLDSVDFNEILLRLLKSKYGFAAGKKTVFIKKTQYKFDDQTVEAEVLHPPSQIMYIQFISKQFGWFISPDPDDVNLSDNL